MLLTRYGLHTLGGEKLIVCEPLVSTKNAEGSGAGNETCFVKGIYLVSFSWSMHETVFDVKPKMIVSTRPIERQCAPPWLR